ncbi:hypothetical protein MMC09_004176 [Bachmanniomyces sp. S44760]|nr:hypothetical protein [Bachmanniomyces sp. S44760]
MTQCEFDHDVYTCDSCGKQVNLRNTWESWQSQNKVEKGKEKEKELCESSGEEEEKDRKKQVVNKPIIINSSSGIKEEDMDGKIKFGTYLRKEEQVKLGKRVAIETTDEEEDDESDEDDGDYDSDESEDDSEGPSDEDDSEEEDSEEEYSEEDDEAEYSDGEGEEY